jgi:hypothetical protein
MVTLVIPGEVPKTNHLYITLPNRSRTMSADGKKFKTLAKDHLAKNYHRELAIFRPNRPYVIAAIFYFRELENRTFGQPKGAESRYKKQDATNCIKLVEDIVSSVSGVDDSCTLEVLIVKRQLPPNTEPFTTFHIWDKEAEGSPFDAILRSL